MNARTEEESIASITASGRCATNKEHEIASGASR